MKRFLLIFKKIKERVVEKTVVCCSGRCYHLPAHLLDDNIQQEQGEPYADKLIAATFGLRGYLTGIETQT